MNYVLNEGFDLVLPSGVGNTDDGRSDVITKFETTLQSTINLNPLKRWEMGLIDLSIPGRGEAALRDQLWFKFGVSNEAQYRGNKAFALLNDFGVLSNIQTHYIDPQIVDKDDSVLIYQEFKKVLNNYFYTYPEAMRTRPNTTSFRPPFDVQLIGGKVNFVFTDDISTYDVVSGEHPDSPDGAQCCAFHIQMSVPLSYLLGCNNFGDVKHERELFDTTGLINVDFSARRSVLMYHSVVPEDRFTLTFYKLDTTKTCKRSRLRCKRRLLSHIYPHAAFNVKCDLLQYNYVGGTNQKSQTLRRITFDDREDKSYTRSFDVKNVLYVPMEITTFQTIKMECINDRGKAINLINPSSSNGYIGQTMMTIRIRPRES